jgi:UDPglucose 6-dehydrogenase/GDP-mannose 6-dehydrogenase
MRRGLAMDMLDAVLDVNDAQPSQVTAIMTSEDRSLEGKAILVLGLAFKPGTDDVREAASLRILPDLIAAGARIVAHDPVATPNFRRAFGSTAETVRFVEDWKSEVHAADAVIVITPWPDYLDLPSLDLTGKTVFDARRAFRPDGFPGARYMAIGRRIAPVGLAARSTETAQ